MRLFLFLLAIGTSSTTLFQIHKSFKLKSTKEFSMWPWVSAEIRLAALTLLCLLPFDPVLFTALGYSLLMNTAMLFTIKKFNN